MNTFDKFKNLTGISIKNFYANLLDFYNNYHDDILRYYTEYNFKYPSDAFFRYEDICKQLEIIISKISLYKGNFETVDIWQIIDELDSIKQKLEDIPAYPRLYKVGFYKKQTNESDNYQTYIMGAYETIDSISKNYNQNSTDLVLINELNEEKWTEKGGKTIILKTNLDNSISNITKEKVVFDVLLGKNLLGKDLPSYFSINEEEEDLEVLSQEQTFLKAVETLFNLQMGQIPEYPNLGVNKDIYGECTKGNVGYTFPILLRQLNVALETDDTILNFQIDNIELNDDQMSYTIYASVQSRLLEKIQFATTL